MVDSYKTLIIETLTNGYIPNFLDYFSILGILCSILVIINKNPVISVLFLIGLFSFISCYLINLGLSFIGLSYLIIYVGAVSILFLFILMLINIRISELMSNTSNSIPLSIIIIISFNFIYLQILPYSITILPYSIAATILNKIDLFLFNSVLNSKNNSDYFYYYITNSDHYYVTSLIWDGNLAEINHITTIGNIMYTNYNIWLIIASYILLLAMIGAIVITIKPKH